MAVLELRNISKHFGAIEALAGVDLAMAPGEIVGLMGDNGAGKSTLVKIIAGNFPPTGGELAIAGKQVHFRKPVEARGEGIEVVYQDLALCDNLTASANIFLGREEKRRFGPFSFLNDRLMHERARALFAELKSETRPADLVRSMSGGQRQAVAIARTRLSKAKIVPGRRGSRPRPPLARRRHRRPLDQPPHARCLRRRRSRRGAAPRPQGRRQGDRAKLA